MPQYGKASERLAEVEARALAPEARAQELEARPAYAAGPEEQPAVNSAIADDARKAARR